MTKVTIIGFTPKVEVKTAEKEQPKLKKTKK